MARKTGRPLELGQPYGAAVLALSEAERERIRRAILVSTTESDSELAVKLGVDAPYVSAMRERLTKLGVIAQYTPTRRITPKPPTLDNLDLFR